jgi:toxin ParE1/3/4
MTFDVILTESAATDLESIFDYIYINDDPVKAARLLDRIEKTFGMLSQFPNRGVHPPELLALGIRDYREIFFKPYRIIYRVRKKQVYIYLITDGRRDMQSLLTRRLLQGK